MKSRFEPRVRQFGGIGSEQAIQLQLREGRILSDVQISWPEVGVPGEKCQAGEISCEVPGVRVEVENESEVGGQDHESQGENSGKTHG